MWFLVLISLIASISLKVVLANDHFCRQHLTFSPMNDNSQLVELINANGSSQAINPPLYFNQSQVLFFSRQFQSLLADQYPTMMDYFTIYDEQPEQGFLMDFRTTFWQPSNDQLPGAIHWLAIPDQSLRKTSWRGNCWQGNLPPVEGIQEEIFSPGRGSDIDDPILDIDFQPQSTERFLAYREILPVNDLNLP